MSELIIPGLLAVAAVTLTYVLCIRPMRNGRHCGMPGMCLPVKDGGIGFDYRLSMGVPDLWVNTFKLNDGDWNMQTLWHPIVQVLLLLVRKNSEGLS